MKIVNGYVCDCGGDERLAKKGIDPENPHEDPVKAREIEERRGVPSDLPVAETQAGLFDPRQGASERADDPGAFVFSGALAGLDAGGQSPEQQRTLDRLV